MSVVVNRCTTGFLIAFAWLVIGVAGTHPAFARTADGSAQGVSLETSGLVETSVPLVSVAADGLEPFDEFDELLGVDLPLPLLGSIAANVISAGTQHAPFDHEVLSEASSAGLDVNLGIGVEGIAIPILALGSGTLASQAGVSGSCAALSAEGHATVEDLSIAVLGINQALEVPLYPPPNFEVLNLELEVPVGIASASAQVLVIANEQTIAPDGSGIEVNALRVSINVEVTVLVLTVTQDISLTVAQSDAAFDNCNEVDLAVEKVTSLEGNATTGEPFEYTVTITNNGSSTATAVGITDQLPEELAFIAFTEESGGDCTHDSGLIACQWLTVPGGDTVTVTYQVMPIAAGTVTNSVSVTTGDVNTGDPGDEIEIIIDKAIELFMEKSIDVEPLAVNVPFNYVFDYVNLGVRDAEQVDFADLVPDGISITAAPADGVCTVGGDAAVFPFDGDGETVLLCLIEVAVPANGGTAQVLLPAVPLAHAEGESPINHASWSEDGSGNPDDPDPETCETDPNCASSEPEEPVQPEPFEDVQVELAITPDPGGEGYPLIHLIIIDNQGTGTAKDLAMDVEFDGVPVIIEVDENDVECIVLSQQVSCEIGAVGPGTAIDIALIVTPEGTGTLTLEGEVTDGADLSIPIAASTVIQDAETFNSIFSDRFEE